MRWALWLVAAAAWGQTFQTEPRAPRQGDVIRVTAPANAASARMGAITIPLYAQSSGLRLGLMPVSANQKPGAYRVEILDAQGVMLHAAPVRVRAANFPTQNVRLRPSVAALEPSPGEMATVSAFRKTVTPQRRWSEPFVKPIDGCMSSPFGVRRLHNGKPTGRYHGGLDQASPEGTPIRAITSGVVRLVREFNVHGHTVGVDHGQGLSSLYLHLSRFEAREGSAVQPGDVIGYVGSTGRSTAPHLHWSLYVNGVAVNPSRWVEVAPCAAPKPPPAKPKRKGTKKSGASTRSK
jgi:murein DD-endopeptidase MepM/ murein hydrolase activator NlpD